MLSGQYLVIYYSAAEDYTQFTGEYRDSLTKLLVSLLSQLERSRESEYDE